MLECKDCKLRNYIEKYESTAYKSYCAYRFAYGPLSDNRLYVKKHMRSMNGNDKKRQCYS